MNVHTSRMPSSDGTLLWLSDSIVESPRADIIVVHGYAEHSGRYDAVARELSAAGYSCHRFDLRGHGHSEGPRAHVARFSEYLDDMRQVVERVVSTARSKMRFIFAHSFGGLISLEFCRLYPDATDGLVMTSPYFQPAFDVPLAKRVLAWAASLVAPKLPFSNTLNAEWLSHDAQIVASYQNDPLVLRTTTPRWFREVESAQRLLREHATEVRLPLLMLLGTEDRIADPDLGKQVFDSLGSLDKQLKIYRGLRHELLNEIGRELVLRDLIDWLNQHSAPQ